jgi:hypothetical protein
VFDCLVTNPPFSGDHIPRLLAFADKLGFQLNKDQIVPTYDKTTC